MKYSIVQHLVCEKCRKVGNIIRKNFGLGINYCHKKSNCYLSGQQMLIYNTIIINIKLVDYQQFIFNRIKFI